VARGRRGGADKKKSGDSPANVAGRRGAISPPAPKAGGETGKQFPREFGSSPAPEYPPRQPRGARGGAVGA